MKTLQTDVAIIGGGPAGLMLAIELGCRGIPCVLLEEDADPPAFPKANATSSRTMEHYRRRGFAEAIRALGLPPTYPQDVVYCTHLASHELARFRSPSRAEAGEHASAHADHSGTDGDFGDYGHDAWPTPELPHRAQQMYIEPVLRARAASYPSVRLRLGHRAMSVAQTLHGVTMSVMPTGDMGSPDGADSVDSVDSSDLADASGPSDPTGPWRLNARYVVGCDGPRSLVRKSLGIRYSGQGSEQRDFFGGQMLSIYFRSRQLYAVLGKDPAWQYWAVNAQQRGLLIAIDGDATFLLAVQLEAGQQASDVDVATVTRAAVGADFDFALIDRMPWIAGYTLVADRMASGRMFLAGDAAHLFTPTGGMGYNTSIDDVVNLGWKLAAVIRDAAPAALLDSYDRERRPVALRNTAFARRMADSIGNICIGRELDAPGETGARARAALGEVLAGHAANEFNIPGLQLGVRYLDSPIVAAEAGPVPQDDPNRYVPLAVPGSRAPHAVVDGKVLFDQFGRDFTLVAFGQDLDTAERACWRDAAATFGITLDLLHVNDTAAHALYGADRVLIRPDHHIAWRGNAHADALAWLALATGHAADR